MYQAAVLAALGLASVTAAQAVSYNGDLLAGFTTASGTDLVYDLGSVANVLGNNGGAGWDLTAALTAAGLDSSLSTVQWGVVGSGTTVNHSPIVWATSLTGPSPINSGNFGSIRSAVGSLMANDFTTAGLGNYATPGYGAAFSWYSQTAQTVANGLSGTAFAALDLNPNTTGLGMISLYDQNSSDSSVTQYGTFALSQNAGIITLTEVPEPSVNALMAVGGGVLMLVGRNKFGRKQS